MPHLFVKDVPAAITFYRKAFGVTELFWIVLPDGTILFIALAPATVGGTPMLLTLEVDDVA